MANNILNVSKTTYYLQQINNQSLPKGIKPIPCANLIKIRNDHLEYAITWFLLAFALLVILIFYYKNITDARHSM